MNQGLLRRHPVATYYVLVFSISWGGLFALAGPNGYPGTNAQVAALFPIAVVFLFAGPSLAGILMTGLLYRRSGLHEFRSRLFRWRVGVRWYATAILTIPLLATAILLSLSLSSSAYLPALITSTDRASLLLIGILIGVAGGSLEELGWTGFAIPELKHRYGVLQTGLIVGFLWGVWHVPITLWAPGTWVSFIGPLFFYAAVLPAYRVLMVWLYDITESMFVTMSMHWSLSASTLFVLAPAVSGTPLVIYYLILAVPLWVAAVAIARRREEAPIAKDVSKVGAVEEEPLAPLAIYLDG